MDLKRIIFLIMACGIAAFCRQTAKVKDPKLVQTDFINQHNNSFLPAFPHTSKIVVEGWLGRFVMR